MKELTYNGITYTVGMRIRATDNTPRPPDRFNKKLEKWKNNNFTGYVGALEEPREPYTPYGCLTLKRDDYPDKPWIEFNFTMPLGGRVEFLPEETAEAA